MATTPPTYSPSPNVMKKLDDILDKHGFGRCNPKARDMAAEILDMADKFCAVIIHLDKTVDDLQYKLAAAREKK